MARSPFSLPISREATAGGSALPTQRMLVLSLCLVICGLIAGALISMRWQEQASAVERPVARQDGPELVAATIQRLEQEQSDLRGQISDLRATLSQLQAQQATDKSALAEVTDDITRQQIAAGLVPLEGPGIVARFDDSTTTVVPSNEDPANYILHDYDLRDVVNTLWGAGAEAISINGQRMVSTSALYCVGTTIIFNVTRLSPPYVVTAIGDPEALQSALRNSPQMAAFNQRALIYDLPAEVTTQASATVPAYEGSLNFRYAEASDDSSGQPTLTPSK